MVYRRRSSSGSACILQYPGLMAPVAHNGYWLVDGAVVNPVPVSLTRAMGADIVIAVDLQHDAHLMQQDLLSLNVSEDISDSEDSLPGINA